ncbi:hypothetical protein [Nocardia brasiliensis]|uniref:hypothetical protein n=1 Tax=Nocardia brasiliensis TaxID=37326 RepID=UPI001895E1F0|nr:hypothetical protein [Nocardia brasiliensis]MBF6545699.1 hypothetical protein [Nocardia brasiliensis]
MAVVIGTPAATTEAMPAIPAMAAAINLPGVGNFDVPVPQEYEVLVQLLDQQIQQAVSAIPKGAGPQRPAA